MRVTHQDSEVQQLEKSDFVLVCGYGRVGKMVCEMLDQNLVRYVAIDKRPEKAVEARSKGLPVFFGIFVNHYLFCVFKEYLNIGIMILYLDVKVM